MEGQVTISLREFNRLKGYEEKLKEFRKHPDTVLIDLGSYCEDPWHVARPDEAIKHITEKYNRELESLNTKLAYYQGRETQTKKRKWYHL